MATLRKPEAAREAALVINLRSRTGANVAQMAAGELERHGIRVVRLRLARRGPELVGAVREAAERGIGTVVIGGGDGTLSSVVDLLAGRQDLTLGLLPLGTGNEVARVLGIPLDLAGACRVVAEGRVEAVNLAEANGNYFLHTGLVGYPARVNLRVPDWMKRRFGKAAYVYGFLISVLRYRPFRARVATSGGVREAVTPVVVVGNSRFHRPGRVLLPPSVVSEGPLLVFMPRDSRRSTMLRIALGLWVTHRPQPESLVAFSADSVTLEADPPQPVDLDGEFARFTPVRFRAVPSALRVLVPALPHSA